MGTKKDLSLMPVAFGTMKQYSLNEVKKHNSRESLWVILDNGVYDLTAFLNDHPGGEEVLFDRAGLDATDCFNTVGHSLDAKERRELYKIGELEDMERINYKPKEDDDAYEKALKARTNFFKDRVIPAAIVVIAFYVYYFIM
ncbi:PREDICTED: cytochrome b5-like [Nicrophorus vespilloides]|uniref:Cytochrome b5 n=1 Tax=Nicrophorus vespilloides TaxID=110193 RepID=A0ABM1MHU3_NICVS|nr:PREDICTED: cytochrome b5-like [Nicrophorus vespilloides]